MGFKIILLGFIFSALACSNKAKDGPGQCEIKCSNAVIADATSFQIAPITPEYDVTCAATEGGYNSETPVFVKFLVTKPNRLNPGDSSRVSAPHVSIQPVVAGAGHTGLGEPGTKGLNTSEDEFCSDSCGVVSLEFYYFCPAEERENPITIQLLSGGLASETFKLNISSKADSDEDSDE